MPRPEGFTPVLPVSVIVPYYAAPEALGRTLATLEGQTYPRDLFEVVVVDDGSPTPLERPRSTPLNVKVVHQDDRGFGLARARNTGVQAAAHEVLLFLDGDMLVEAGWVQAHARWHHIVSDGVTIGFRAHVSVDGVDAGTIRNRPGTLKEMFAGRRVEMSWVERHMTRTDDLTSTADDPFRVVVGANLGVRRNFYELVGGFDESFTQWGMEDTEFGYRAYTRGGLLVPVRDAFGWHQGPWAEDRERKRNSLRLQRAKTTHLIAHPGFRAEVPGRIFTVPQYVVSIQAGDLPVERLLPVVEQVLADRVHDLVVRIEIDADHNEAAWLRRQFDPDPRVRVAPVRSALDEFPATPFHVTLPAEATFPPDIVHRLRAELGRAVVGRVLLSKGVEASITRAWALHRARRTGGSAAEFGDEALIPARKLGLGAAGRLAAVIAGIRRERWWWRVYGGRLFAELKQIRNLRQALSFLAWLGRAARRRAGRLLASASSRRRAPNPPGLEAPNPPGMEIMALGARARAVFYASTRVARTTAAGQHVDVAVADTVSEAAGVTGPVVVLAAAPPLLSVPAFDPRVDNPVGWQRRVGRTVAALGPLERLPAACTADRVVGRDDRTALREIHHLEDVQAFHGDPLTRAGRLARLAAAGVPVHLADGDRRLAPYLGAELFELMTCDVRDLDVDGREALSVRMRRAALREHSLGSRARQVGERALADPPRLPLVSILLVTRRPELLERALSAVRRQSYPRLELILGLHGEGFGAVASGAAGPTTPMRVLRLDAAWTLGSVLNAATEAARGTLLTKMDDDDLYGPDHVWDLVLAREYSQAPLVGKGGEFVYLAASNKTIRRMSGGGERYGTTIAGGALMIARHELDRIGGWRRVPRHVDQALLNDVAQAGSKVYRTHPYGFLLVRHGRRHTWVMDDARFLAQADLTESGWRPDLAGIDDAAQVYA